MTDLQRLIDEFDELCGSADMLSKSLILGNFPNSENCQIIDIHSVSHLSQFPTPNQGRSAQTLFCSNKTTIEAHESGLRELSSAEVGNVGNVGNATDTLAEADGYDFPLSHSLLGKEEEKWEIGSCRRPLLDLNRAGPQRADWCGGNLAALAPQLVPASRPGDPLPISPSEVHAGVERELRALATLGRTGSDALRDAIAMIAVKIRNSPVLVERQAHDGRCHACGEPLDGTQPEVAILQAKGGSRLWVHAGACHDEHSRRRAALVEAIMAAAGFGGSEEL